jgi:hypothetical protein
MNLSNAGNEANAAAMSGLANGKSSNGILGGQYQGNQNMPWLQAPRQASPMMPTMPRDTSVQESGGNIGHLANLAGTLTGVPGLGTLGGLIGGAMSKKTAIPTAISYAGGPLWQGGRSGARALSPLAGRNNVQRGQHLTTLLRKYPDLDPGGPPPADLGRVRVTYGR